MFAGISTKKKCYRCKVHMPAVSEKSAGLPLQCLQKSLQKKVLPLQSTQACRPWKIWRASAAKFQRLPDRLVAPLVFSVEPAFLYRLNAAFGLFPLAPARFLSFPRHSRTFFCKLPVQHRPPARFFKFLVHPPMWNRNILLPYITVNWFFMFF